MTAHVSAHKHRSPEERITDGEVQLLSNLDVLSVLIGDAAEALLREFPMIADLDDATPVELGRVTGLDTFGVARLIAARELCRRRALEKAIKGAPVFTSVAAVELIEPLVRGESREMLIVLPLDTKKRLSAPPITISIGTNDSAPCHPRELFRPLIKVSASACLITHIHPSSGEPVPSPDDVMVTTRLREIGELIGIPVVDHIVIGSRGYISMADHGLL